MLFRSRTLSRETSEGTERHLGFPSPAALGPEDAQAALALRAPWTVAQPGGPGHSIRPRPPLYSGHALCTVSFYSFQTHPQTGPRLPPGAGGRERPWGAVPPTPEGRAVSVAASADFLLHALHHLQELCGKGDRGALTSLPRRTRPASCGLRRGARLSAGASHKLAPPRPALKAEDAGLGAQPSGSRPRGPRPSPSKSMRPSLFLSPSFIRDSSSSSVTCSPEARKISASSSASM